MDQWIGSKNQLNSLENIIKKSHFHSLIISNGANLCIVPTAPYKYPTSLYMHAGIYESYLYTSKVKTALNKHITFFSVDMWMRTEQLVFRMLPRLSTDLFQPLTRTFRLQKSNESKQSSSAQWIRKLWIVYWQRHFTGMPFHIRYINSIFPNKWYSPIQKIPKPLLCADTLHCIDWNIFYDNNRIEAY